MFARAHRGDKHPLGPNSQTGVGVGGQVGGVAEPPGTCPGTHACGSGKPRAWLERRWWQLGILRMAREHPGEIWGGSFVGELQGRVAIVATAKADEVLASGNLGRFCTRPGNTSGQEKR